MSFDEIIDRRGSHCVKWDMLEPLFGLSPESGLAMWVADMDFRPPQVVQQALTAMIDHGIYGYFGDEDTYRSAIGWWMQNRHGWTVEPDQIFTTHGLVNGTALCIHTWSQPGDAVVLFTPVYHAFARIIKAAGRTVTECTLVNTAGRYQPDFAAADAAMTGREKLLIVCSPQNPGGRVWTVEELNGFADFARRHDLILVCDEIHHDLVFPGNRHVAMPVAVPDILERLVMMTATTKTFNMAGAHVGNVIIPDPGLRRAFAGTVAAFGISPNSFGIHMATAAYSPEGAAWVDGLMDYLDGNRRLFDAGVNAIPGLASMPLEATYLSWVDFSGTGMAPAEFTARVQDGAGIATNVGTSFGAGGESFLRFNIATPRARVAEAVERLQKAFADLQ